MSSNYKQYLAAQILSESNIVTYRSLSRALKIHSNVAKKMLFEFHRQQNGKRPGSVSATYLVTGFQTVTPPAAPNGLADGDGDIPMPSSPYLSSPAPPQASQEEPVRQRVITLAKEDHLDCMAATLLDPQDRQRLIGKAIKEKYVEISSIHVYSVGLSSIKNLQILSNVTQQIIANYIGEDPLVHNTTYGVIQNPNVKRRTSARPPPSALPAKAPSKAVQDTKATNSVSTSKESSPAPPSALTSKQAVKEERSETKRPNKPASAPVKRATSDIFKAFAKSQPKLKQEETGSSVESQSASKPQKEAQDVDMGNVSEGEDEEPEPSVKPNSTALRDAKTAREAKLRQMMEDDEDEEMKDASQEQDMENGEPEPEEEESKPLDASQKKPEEEQPTVTVSNGRRRGKRKVIKKKTTKDADGYLVTKEEAVWESFFEDEPTPAPKSKSIAPSSSTAKGKKSGGKPGQRDIKNFFAKK